MAKILAAILGLIMVASSPVSSDNHAKIVVDHFEGDFAVVEFSNDTTVKTLGILADEINGEIMEGMEIPVTAVEGKFYGDLTCKNYQGIENVYYQFRSDNDTVWWVLTIEEIGHIPNADDKYILYYTDNGTVKGDPVCDCLPEWDCECYLYDDIFFYIERG